MTERCEKPSSPSTQYVDQIFGTLAYPNQAAPGNGAPLFQAAPAAVPCQPTDLTAEYDWLREERKRMEAYTLHQFGAISQQREELLNRRAEVETQFALREQELNRKMRLLAERSDAVAIREKQLSEGEATLAAQKEGLTDAEQRLQQYQQTGAKLQRDIELQRLTLEQVRFQTTQLQEAARVAQAELEAFERLRQNRSTEWEKEQAKSAQRLQKLEQRERALLVSEESMRRREGEQDQLEAQLRCEIEERERQLALEQQEIAELRRRLRQQAGEAAQGVELFAETSLLDLSRRPTTLPAKHATVDSTAGDTVHG